jgi:hypothetical protein
MPDTQRALGHIEGVVDQVLTEVKSLRVDLIAHAADDRANFTDVRAKMAAGFTEADRARNQHLNEQDVKLDGLKQDSDRAKGAGYVILGLLGALATFAGGAVLAILNGWLSLHR